MQRFTFISSRNWFFWVDKKQLLSNFFVKWATFGQLLKIFGATFERYPSNLCKSLDTTEISFQLWSITAPLSDLTRNGQRNKVEWGEAQEKAYQTIKSYLTIEPILRLSDQAKTYFLWTDTSSNGIGAVLMQRHDEKFFLVCYASKKLSSVERNYSTFKKECLAIVWGIKRFHLYLYGVPFVLQTDHEPLKYMDSAKYTNARLMRWAMFLQSYNFKVEAIKGSENVGADYLSRVEE